MLLAGIGTMPASDNPLRSASAVTSAMSRTPQLGSRAQALIEGLVARRRMLAVALERPVEEELAVRAQTRRGVGQQAHRHRPGRDVDDIGAEDSREFGQPL